MCNSWHKRDQKKICLLLSTITVHMFSGMGLRGGLVGGEGLRLSMLYMETNNCLWQHSSPLLYASLSRNVVRTLYR